MALIRCPECNNTISDKAKKCIHCGVDMEYIISKKNTKEDNMFVSLGKLFEAQRDYVSAYKMYMRAMSDNNAFAEKRLGAMTIEGKGTEKNFFKGVGFYLCAAEDGDKEASIILSSILPEDAEVEEELKPLRLLIKAFQGDVDYIYKLAKSYIEIYGGFTHRAIDWLYAGIKLKDLKCHIYLMDILRAIDSLFYNQDKENYEIYYQQKQHTEIIKKLIDHDMIFNERLVVNSKERIEEVMNLLVNLIINNYTDKYIIGIASKFYLELINETNSFKRGLDKEKGSGNTSKKNNPIMKETKSNILSSMYEEAEEDLLIEYQEEKREYIDMVDNLLRSEDDGWYYGEEDDDEEELYGMHEIDEDDEDCY